MKTNKILKIFIAIILLVSIHSTVIAATGVVNSDTVRIREKPTTGSKIIGLVSIGDKMTITGEENNWYKVKGKDDHGNNVEGYIRKDLLKVEGELIFEEKPEQPEENNNNDSNETPNQPEEPNTNSGEASGGGASGEETPNGDGENNEETPNENPNNNGETPNENPEDEPNEGAGSVKIEKDDRTISVMKAVEGVSAGQKLQLSEEIKIKILPSANSSNIAKLQANTEVTILEKINSWCRVETQEGACGWVRIDQ